MGPADADVWESALRAKLVEADRYDYDVRLGGSLALHIDDGHVLKPMWATLLRKRVDVVAWTGETPVLIEVKPVASFAALGQCLGYGWLWKKERGSLSSVSLACVCAIADPDLLPVFEAYGVKVISLPAVQAEQVLLRWQTPKE